MATFIGSGIDLNSKRAEWCRDSLILGHVLDGTFTLDEARQCRDEVLNYVRTAEMAPEATYRATGPSFDLDAPRGEFVPAEVEMLPHTERLDETDQRIAELATARDNHSHRLNELLGMVCEATNEVNRLAYLLGDASKPGDEGLLTRMHRAEKRIGDAHLAINEDDIEQRLQALEEYRRQVEGGARDALGHQTTPTMGLSGA